jgi:hypothetical protein
MIKQTLLLLMILLTATFAREKQPAWANERPIDRSSYTGIGVVPKSSYASEKEWRDAAKSVALNDMVSEISVQIEGESKFTSSADENGVSEQLKESIKAETKANLEAHKFVDSWEDRKQYFVYYKLSKADWAAVEARRLAAGVKIAHSSIDAGDRFKSSGNAVDAAHSYIAAFKALLPILHLNPAINNNPENKPLMVEVDERMGLLAGTIKVNYSMPFFQGVKKLYGDEKHPVQFSLSGKPVASLPVIMNGEPLFTSTDGGIYILPTSLPEISNEVISIECDYKKIIPQNEKNPIIHNWVSGFNWPVAKLRFVYEKPCIRIIVEENNMESPLSMEKMGPAIKKALETEGYCYTRSAINAQYTIKVVANSRDAGGYGSLYFAFLDVNWLLKDPNGKELVKRSIKPIKGGALDYDNAGLKAFDKGKIPVAEEILSWIRENM